MSSPSVLSQTLQSIAITKIHELEKQRESYEFQKRKILNTAEEADQDQRERVLTLLTGVKELGLSSSQICFSNIHRWLDQSQYDPSIPGEMLDGFETQLRTVLDVQSRRLALGDLYSRLLTEWLKPTVPAAGDSPIHETATLDDSFEIVERDRLQQLRKKFESVVFTSLETDEVDIDNYLQDIFGGDGGEAALKRLRFKVKGHSENFLTNNSPFDQRTLRWCIKGLLANELLNDEKKATLQDFLHDTVALGEICDVLNMKQADFKSWTWNAGNGGMPVESRKQLNGKYRVMMDEDVLQAIFLHYIGITWSVSMKITLRDLIRYTHVWGNKGKRIPPHEADKRQYYLDSDSYSGGSVEKERLSTYKQDFFLSQLPSSVYAGAGGYDDGEDVIDDEEERENGSTKGPKEIRQQLLRQLATEIHLRRTIDGEVAVVQSDCQWFATGLSHSTIFSVLRFMGMPEVWIVFFKKFLEAPLNMGLVSNDPSASSQVRIRRRGVPMAHALEKFFGEVVLFFMDLAVSREANMLLYRFHDDLWLCGEPNKCAEAWKAMQKFSILMGLEFNMKKTGSVYLTRNKESRDAEILATLPQGSVSYGFLILEPSTGDWVIDQGEVDKHIKQLQKQLLACTSVLTWVQTWNSCIGRFFSHTFGEPANCFGTKHVDSILETYKRMQNILFSGSGDSVTEHLKRLIAERFNVTDLPVAFIFMPEQLGGLGLRNPFIPLLLIRNQLFQDPAERMRTFLADEEMEYKDAKKHFEEFSDQERRRRFRDIYTDDYSNSSSLLDGDLNTFMSMEEFVRWRELQSGSLLRAYRDLMLVPTKNDIVVSEQLRNEVAKLAQTQPDLKDLLHDSEKKWIMQLHSRELFDRCGGMSIVDKGLLPIGIMSMLRKRNVTWQMVL